MPEQAQAAGPPWEDAVPPANRAPWGTLDRDDIIEAAVTIVGAGGCEEMTIRSLAAGLGVAPMSLYRHIRDQDDLLEQVADRLLAKAWRPAAPEDDWQVWVIEAAAKLRAFLVSQPAALHVYLRHPVVSPAAVERMDAMMEVLRRVGAGEGTTRRAYGACTPTPPALPRSKPPGPGRLPVPGRSAASLSSSPPTPPLSSS